MNNIEKQIYYNNRELLRRESNNSLLSFTMYNNFAYNPNWHHIAIAKELTRFLLSDKPEKLMLIVPPQHGKSTLASINLPAFAHGINPELKIVGASYSIDLARKFNREIQRIISGDEYAKIFPETKLNEKNVVTTQSYLRNSEEYEVVNHSGSYKAVGIMGGLSGRPIDLGIIDDPIKDKLEAYSCTYRERIWDWYLNVFMTRLHNQSKQLLIMTRWHKDDLAGRILEFENDWKVVKFSAIKEKYGNEYDKRSIGESLWEEKHSLNKTLKLKDMSIRTFNSLYQGNPTLLEGDLWKRHWFRVFNMIDIQGETVNFMVDTAYTKDEQNDPSCIFAYVIRNKQLYIVDVHTKRYEFSELCKAIINRVALFGTSRSIVEIEPKASGKSVVQRLRESTMLNVKDSKAPTSDKIARTTANSDIVSSGRVLLLNNGNWYKNYLDQVCGFPNMKHDEEIDVTNMAIEKLIKKKLTPSI